MNRLALAAVVLALPHASPALAWNVKGPSGDVQLKLTNDGNLGVGTPTPGAKLEVAGQVKITGGSPGAGKVLTSDANGLASWQTGGGGGGAGGFRYVVFDGRNMNVLASSGVASLTRWQPSGGAGGYVITWSNPFSSTHYAVVGSCNAWQFGGLSFTIEGSTTGATSGNRGIWPEKAQVGCRHPRTNENWDSDYVSVVAIGG